MCGRENMTASQSSAGLRKMSWSDRDGAAAGRQEAGRMAVGVSDPEEQK